MWEYFSIKHSPDCKLQHLPLQEARKYLKDVMLFNTVMYGNEASHFRLALHLFNLKVM